MRLKFSVRLKILQVAAFLTFITSSALVYHLYSQLPPSFQDDDNQLPIENEKEPWKNFRLPENILPRHYSITLKPDVVNDISYGEEIITVEVVKQTNTIIIHAIEGGFTDITEFVVTQDGLTLGIAREL